MDTAKIQQLLDLIDECVMEGGKTWREKQQAVLTQAEGNERIKTNLEEFASWFEV